MKRTLSWDALIKKASIIGTHTPEFGRKYITMTDTGGHFVDASSKRLTYGKYPSPFLRTVVI